MFFCVFGTQVATSEPCTYYKTDYMPSVNLKKPCHGLTIFHISYEEKLKIMIKCIFFSCITSNFTSIYSSTGISFVG